LLTFIDIKISYLGKNITNKFYHIPMQKIILSIVSFANKKPKDFITML